MPKITIEIDTDKKDATFSINGNAVNVDSFSVCSYPAYNVDDSAPSQNRVSTSYGISAGDDNDQSCVTVNFSFNTPAADDKNTTGEVYYLGDFNTSKEINKVFHKSELTAKLAKALGGVDPYLTIDLSTNNRYWGPRQNSMPPVTQAEKDKQKEQENIVR